MELKVLEGNRSQESTRPAAKSITGIPSPPTDLRGEAFAEWCRVTNYLSKVGRIELVDYAALVVYCSAWSIFDEARKAMEEHGTLTVGRDGGLVKNPAAQVMRDAADTMLKFGSKFGVTPKDRQNMGIGAEAEPEDDVERELRAL